MISAEFPWLTAITFFPLVAAAFIPLLPRDEGKTVRWYAMGVGLLELALILVTFGRYYDVHNPALQLVDVYPWVPQIGLNWSVGVDGLSMPLIILTGLITTLSILAAWNTTHKARLFFFLILAMYTAQIAVFASQDILLFFISWELELVPVYLLISIWGGQNKLYAATKFILYTAIASIFILVAALAMAFYGDNVTFNLSELALKDYSLTFELLVYTALFIAFGVKLPIFPFHTWLPDAHSEAPAPVSMILAGVLLKMAGYGLIRMNIEMLPNAHATVAPTLAVLGAINIVYASLTAFAQKNLKRRMAYSSIAHMGFVLIGLAAFTSLGITGALLQMISHGLIAAALFFLSGVTYERTHTLLMDKMGGLAKDMPTVFALFTAGSLASLALPGMSGFVSELTIFLGFSMSDVYGTTFRSIVIILAAIGVVLTPIYLLSMLRQVFYGNRTLQLELPSLGLDAKPREAFIALCLIVPIIAIGVYPKLAIQTYEVKTVEVASRARDVLPIIAENPQPLYSQLERAPEIAVIPAQDVIAETID